jgi:hypothetical protein
MADSLGVRSASFSVSQALGGAWKLLGAVPATVAGISAVLALAEVVSVILAGVDPRALQARIRSGQPYSAELVTPLLLAAARGLTLGVWLRGALLAQMASVVQGEAAALPQSLKRGLAAWPRLLGAQVVAGLLTGLGIMLCCLPGLYAAVTVSLVLPIAYLEPGASVVDGSAELTRGHRWEMLALVLVTFGSIMAVAMTGGVLTRVAISADVPEPVRLTVSFFTTFGVELAACFGVGLSLAAYHGLKNSRARDAARAQPAGQVPG